MGIVVAARIKSMEGFQMIMNFLVLPIFFLSGAMFPLIGLPSWMDKLVKIDPLTYGVDALRGVVLGSHQIKVAGKVLLKIPTYPLGLNLLIVASFGLVMVTLAILEFNRQEKKMSNAVKSQSAFGLVNRSLRSLVKRG
jgi:ABC-2 type transport system permease protein